MDGAKNAYKDFLRQAKGAANSWDNRETLGGICYGERFTERSLTVTRTCRLQGRNPFHFLVQVMAAAFIGSPHPTR